MIRCRNILVELSRKGIRLVILGLLAYSVGGLAQSSDVTKWTQAPDPNGWDVNLRDQLLASDFLCTQTGPITDVHLWTSFNEDITGPFNFTLSLWTDVPKGPNNEYSYPGQQIKEWQVSPSFISTIPEAGQQGWLDPSSGQYYPENHVNMYRVDFLIPQGDQFVQQEGNVYWLGVQATQVEPIERASIGWKTALEVWNDDAVFMSPTGGWQELMDPTPGLIRSLDLAFEITTAPTVPDGGASVLLLGLSLLGLWGAKRFIR